MPSPASSPPASEAVDRRPGTAADDAVHVYVHWPFCLAKCPYCDFNSHVAAEPPDAVRWQRAFLDQLGRLAPSIAGRPVDSVFFGGGTPSLMPPGLVAAVLDAVARLGVLAADAEVTLEANPTSTEAARLAAFRAAGVNRVSLGVQSLDDRALAGLGRRHSAAEAVRAIHLAARTMPRWSFDLIYARPGQTCRAWRAELQAAVALAGDHLSLYQLSIEPGTAFHQRRIAAADPELAADLFELTGELLAAAGLPAYEISNHARPGGACRHNLGVWRGDDYLGLGPGAHGRRRHPADGGPEATAGIAAPAAWLAAVEAGGDGLAERTPLTARARTEELLLTGLRLADGVDRARIAALTGVDPFALIDAVRLAALVEAGDLAVTGPVLRLTAAGRLRLDAIVGYLLTVA
jgi:oxygen-independent coproporphyrinogen-3 oxidase